MFAVVSDKDSEDSRGGIDAGAWVKAVVVPLGGRGGGKPNNAQGSATIAGEEAVQSAMDSAKAYIANV